MSGRIGSRRPRGRSWSSLDGAAQGEVDALLARAGESASCPHCGFTWNPWSPQVETHGLPDRAPEHREERVGALELTALRLAERFAQDFAESASWDIWLAGLVLIDVDRDRLYFAAPGLSPEHLNTRYRGYIAGAASSLAGRQLGAVVGSWPTAGGRTLGELLKQSAPAPTRRPDAGAHDNLAGPPEENA